jgi:uncharacterized protein
MKLNFGGGAAAHPRQFAYAEPLPLSAPRRKPMHPDEQPTVDPKFAAPSLDPEPMAPSAAVPAAPLTPVDANERIVTLDVLRGIALFGVLVANIWLWFSGINFLFPGYNAEVWSGSADGIAFLLVAFFVSGKAITTFSFLFGLGFAVQMMRAEARGRGIVRHHARRLAVLLVFGALHAVFLWYGDILFTYALLGFGLLLFRKRREKTLLVWAAVLVLLVSVLMGAVPLVMAALNPDAAPEPATVLAEMTERNGALLALFASAEPARIVSGNLAMLREWWLTPKVLFHLVFFGIFLLGLWAGRRRIFEDPAAHRVLLRRLIAIGFPVGIAATAVGTALRSIPPEEFLAITWMPLAMSVTATLGTLPFALAYIATATLLMERVEWRGRLAHFAPVGRMALTNYLAQTVICLALFYGGGLVGQVGAIFGIFAALVIFPIQMAWSTWWLARFRFGPMEWLWRSLVYRRLQPMRLAPPLVPGVQPTVR